MWTVLNPLLKLEWIKKHYPPDFVREVREELLQAVSPFNFVKPL
jgi:hypothetical protein